MDKILIVIGAVIAGICLAVGLSAVIAIPVMLLWDWLMPILFGLSEITFLQAWGLNFLASMLFKTVSVKGDS